MTTSCISEEAALRILAEPGGEDTAEERAHVAVCEACRGFVAALARVMVPPSAPSFGGWGADAAVLAPGTALNLYVIEAPLGRGGMGVVYAGHDARLDRPVAIKVLSHRASPRAVVRLRQEAAALAQFSHPNVVEVFDFGECEAGPFLVMERLHGRTLGEWLAEGPRSAGETVRAYVQAGQGLAEAHANGIVHRDFKPANVMWSEEGEQGRVKVLDFGLSAQLARGTTDPEGTRGSWRLREGEGTPRYAAPEQLGGSAATVASDQFSFCVALFESLCGHVPYAGSTPSERRTAMLSGRIEPLTADVSPEVEAALARGLQLDPRRRHRSMLALLSELEPRPRARALWVGVAVASLGVLAGWPRPEAACADGTARMDQAWWGHRDRFVGRPEVVTKAARVDEFVEYWLEARSQLCALRDQERSRFEQASACLERQASAVERVSSRLQHVTSASEPMPSNLLGDLRDPSECVALRATGASDPVLRDELGALQARAELAEIDGFIDPAEFEDVSARMGTLLGRARQLGDAGSQAAILRLQATFEYLRGDYAAAERTFEAAYFVADLADDASMKLHVCEGLILLLVLLDEDPHRVDYWAAQARRAAGSIATDNVRGRAAWLEAIGARANGRLEDAMTLATAAVEWLHSDDETRLLAYNQLGEVAMLSGDGTRARAALDAAVDLAERELGDSHPYLAQPINALASVEMAEGNVEAGMKLIARAIEVTPESKAVPRAFLRANLGNGMRELGRFDAALEELTSARTVFEAEFGPNNPRTIRLAIDGVDTLIELGRVEEAREEIAMLLLTPGLRDNELASILWTQASLAEDPRPDLDRILELEGVDPSMTAATRTWLAEVEASG